MKTKGLVVVSIIVIFLSLLIMFVDDIPYIAHDDSYIALSRVTEVRNETLVTEQKAFDLAISLKDMDMIKILYSNRVQSETEMIEFAKGKLDIAKSIAQLILIICFTMLVFMVERKRKYNKNLKRDC